MRSCSRRLLAAFTTLFVFCASFAQVDGARLGPFMAGGRAHFLALKSDYNVLAIVDLVDAPASEARQQIGGTPPRFCKVEIYTARVVDAQGLAPNVDIPLVVPSEAGRPLAPGRYLCLGSASDGVLRFPQGFGELGNHNELLQPALPDLLLTCGSEAEIATSILIPTGEARVPRSGDLGSDMAIALAQTLKSLPDGTFDLVYRHVVCQLRDPSLEGATSSARNGDEWTNAIKEAAAARPPAQRTLVLGLLIYGKVVGSEQLFVEAITEAAANPLAFKNGEPMLQYDLFFARPGEAGVPRGYSFVPNPNLFVDLAVRSRNAAATEFFLRNLGGRADSEQLVKLVGLLTASAAGIRLQVVQYLNRINPDSCKPVVFGTVNGRYGPTNLEEVASYWRQFFGIGNP